MVPSWPSLKRQVSLKDYSTFKIGGPASYLVEVESLESLLHYIEFAKEQSLPYLVIGRGSNTLFDDRGYEGLIIINRISYKKQNGCEFEVGAGYSFALLGVQTARNGYQGLEFASGIPASVGGAIYMNAGAGGFETKDSLMSVTYLHSDGIIQEYQKSELSFSYRYSTFQELKGGAIISAKFQLTEDLEAKSRQEKILSYRLKTQPYDLPSCGCCFQNPRLDLPAGKMIEDLKLKGCNIGDAFISELHGNFIVNKGEASSKDVIDLLEMIEDKVKKEYGVDLHREIKVVPYA